MKPSSRLGLLTRRRTTVASAGTPSAARAAHRQFDELHIASGIHGGVTTAMAQGDDASPTRIGHAEDNDIVLIDAGVSDHHAELRHQQGRWEILAHAPATGGDGKCFPLGEWIALTGAVRLGPVWLAILPAGKATPDWHDWQARAALHDDPDMAADAAEDDTGRAGGNAAIIAAASTAAPSGLRSGRPRLSMLTRMLLILPASCTLLAPRAMAPAHPQQRTVQAVPEPPRPIDAALQVILRQPQWSALQAGRRSDGVVEIRGWLPDRTAYENLAEQLARITPRPALAILTADEVLASVRAMLDESAPMLGVSIANDTATLAGAADSKEQVDAAMARIQHALPALQLRRGQVDLPDTMVQHLQAALKAAGLTQARAHWDGRKILVDGTVPAQKEAALSAVLASFDQRYDNRVPFAAKGVGLPTTAAPALPFPIRAVVGGDNPYLMVGDGTIIAPGGVYRGWHLKAIEPGQIVFDSPRSLMVQR